MREPIAPAYYDRRAAEYDDWYLGRGLFADPVRDGFDDELGLVTRTLAALEPAATLASPVGRASSRDICAARPRGSTRARG